MIQSKMYGMYGKCKQKNEIECISVYQNRACIHFIGYWDVQYIVYIYIENNRKLKYSNYIRIWH